MTLTIICVLYMMGRIRGRTKETEIDRGGKEHNMFTSKLHSKQNLSNVRPTPTVSFV